MIQTPRLLLRPWGTGDYGSFAALSADPEVMDDLGGPMARSESDAKLKRYKAAFEQSGLSRWAVERRSDGKFIGYAGVLHRSEHVIGSHFDMAWRLVRSAWGHGYATEAASAALEDAFTRAGLTEILAYTSPANLRSQAVMSRLSCGVIHRKILKPQTRAAVFGMGWCESRSPPKPTFAWGRTTLLPARLKLAVQRRRGGCARKPPLQRTAGVIDDVDARPVCGP